MFVTLAEHGSRGAARWTVVTFPAGLGVSLKRLMTPFSGQLKSMHFRIVSLEGAGGYPSLAVTEDILRGRCFTHLEFLGLCPEGGDVIWMTFVGSDDSEWLSGQPTRSECDEKASLLGFCADGSDWTIAIRDPVLASKIRAAATRSTSLEAESGFPVHPVRWDWEVHY